MSAEADIRRRQYRRMIDDTMPLAWIDRTTLDTSAPIRHGAVQLLEPLDTRPPRHAVPGPPTLPRRRVNVASLLSGIAAVVFVALAIVGTVVVLGAIAP